MRRAFSKTLVQVAGDNDRVVFLTGDLGFQVFDEFEQRFGPRYVNAGVAEAQLMCAAAGLAIEGWRPVAYSIASFATARPFEQIRISICYPRLPVVIVGAGGGYTYSSSGVTHHAADDLALMSFLPGMTVVAPGCPDEICQLFPQLLDLDGPSYLRIGKFGEADYHVEAPALIGKARLLKEGEKVAIICTGDIIHVAMKAVEHLYAKDVRPLLYQMHTVKPLDTGVLNSLIDKVSTIIVVEEHLPNGGLASAVSLWRTARKAGPVIVRLGAPDEMILGNPSRDELYHRIGIDEDAIAGACLKAWTD